MNQTIEIIRSIPSQNIFFEKQTVPFNTVSPEQTHQRLSIHPEVSYQEILGFGGAFTESSAYNYSLMDPATKEEFLRLYFDKEKGIGYNFGRTCIASCDFSLDIYSYVEEGDETLETFNIQREQKYVIPFLQDALKKCCEELILFSSPWSPPAYMKDNQSVVEGGQLLEKYKPLWARHYAKYVKAFAENGIKISAITIQNEPRAKQPWESCYYTAEGEKQFLKNYLIPCLDEDGLSDLKIIIWDHNKDAVYERACEILSDKEVYDRVWAVGHHWYTGEYFEGVKLVNEVLKKPTICTEFCCSFKPQELNSNAELYAKEIIGDLKNGDIAICDWNLLLDENGGPYHNRKKRVKDSNGVTRYEDIQRGCYAPILYDKNEGKMILTPIYYYIGHFSKFVNRGAKVIATVRCSDQIDAVSFSNPDKSVVTVILNLSDSLQPVNLSYKDTCTALELEPHSIMTVKIG